MVLACRNFTPSNVRQQERSVIILQSHLDTVKLLETFWKVLNKTVTFDSQSAAGQTLE